ncbi:MAG: hypothetical protein EWV53_20625 [Microcystis panniformis Mp_MB_F_20051200_S9]|uniref:Uncharacterized protein n=1 Tax=Microcystis panniformis Mp_MB_F_20051200_S9 TaxID=2486223 RepID=A0A552PKR4_9CHRO|nr:MAG: hypothetical protein EWV87_22755 [Microcystis panniformis Mp_GB_SS_20050300_S99]TRV53219.1 MAG: hypothetical protein EWV43_00240 [Microcystis panniformis Mp_MB_F_20080800_S26D]TRV54610.1 MAG: hypothetical protein EWV42_03840 [Microcystis panniformis Mp_GB_SS_20050300_S99D]TRV57579.1 MAG: hypothetical protein EWV53_20625 [Microcystis panniformis Mp_MB_F_20051200_S9]TRV61295.1 MAG: hypothetical protein EWV69_08140 [Microcystis panniformis Mp_MB_F_20080800_S26]TRV67866.1 MAG: hypothetical
MYLGIDFGTCYSSAALILDGIAKPIKEPNTKGYSFPSSIFVNEKGEILVSQVAENSRQKAPHHYRREFKRDLGSPDPYSIGNFILLPEELIAQVICKLKSEADKVIEARRETILTDAIVTIPATYSPYKRNLMEQSAISAGFSHVKLLEEPVAAAIYYSHNAKIQEGEIILVYDLGGGTFDATLIQKQDSGYQLIGIPKGLSHCGGIDFDRQIYQQLKSQCSLELRQQIEAKNAWLARAIVSDLCRDLKHQLSEQEMATIYIPIGLGNVESFSLTRQEFNEMIAPLIQETIECCDQMVRSAAISWSNVNHLLLVGGSCRIPYVKEALEKQFESKCLMVDDPELAVCLGAAIYGVEIESNQVSKSTVQKTISEQKSKVQDSIKSPNNLETSANLYYSQGLARSDEKAYYRAIKEFNQALQIKPDYAKVYYARALVRQSLEDMQGSLEDLQQAAKLFLNQNYLSEYQKTLEKIQEVNKLSSSQSTPSQINTNVEPELTVDEIYQQGLIYISQDNCKKALEQFEQVLQTCPDHLGVYLHRAFAYSCLGEYQKTIDDSNQVIAINSNCFDAYINRGLGYFALGDHQSSRRDLNQAVQIDTKASRAYLCRSLIQAFFSNHQGAIADYNHLKQIDMRFNSSEHNRILALAVQGNKGGIIQYVKQATQQFFIPLKFEEFLSIYKESKQSKINNNSFNYPAISSYFYQYLAYQKERLISENFEWQENIVTGNFPLQAVAKGTRKLQAISWDTFFVFSDLFTLDIYTFRHFVRESFKYCGTLRGRNIKLKGILCYPVAIVQNLDSATAIAIEKEPPSFEMDEFMRASYIFPFIFDLQTQKFYSSEQRPLVAWAVWPGVKKIAQALLL